MKEKIANYIRAGYPGIYIVSSEEVRVEAELKTIAETLKHRLYAWSVSEGLTDTADGTVQDAPEPITVLSLIPELSENVLVLLRDFHLFLDNPDPFLTRALKDVLRHGKSNGKNVIMLGCRKLLPSELEREFVIVDFSLPGKEALGIVLDNIAVSAGQPQPKADHRELLLGSATGLTSIEAENAFALSIVESNGLSPVIVAREKAQELKRGGLLEVYQSDESLEDIGGLDSLKSWLMQRRDTLSQEAHDYGLPSPKGLLIVGIPGTGKSLTAKATASVFQRPLIKLDAGRLFAGLVGQSESNLRSVIATVEAIAPVVLWIDEIEKGFSGSKSSGSTDGGTASRVFGTFLSWMQERIAPVFIVATVNDVTQLPPEMLRKGRFDELFFIDLPNREEREAIWRIQITKYGREPANYDTLRLAKSTEGFTGSEIEQGFIDSLYDAFERREEPSDLTIMMALNEVVPLSKLMSEQINALRRWSKGRARPATLTAETSGSRKFLALN